MKNINTEIKELIQFIDDIWMLSKADSEICSPLLYIKDHLDNLKKIKTILTLTIGPDDDMLDEIMTTQLKFQEQLGYHFERMEPREISAYIKEYSLHAEHELHEMLTELPYFKPWKNYDTDWIDTHSIDTVKEEFVDAFHFLINIALALGFTANDLYEAYLDKQSINHKRQDDIEHYKTCMED